MKEFQTAAFRHFKVFVGELTAYAAGSYVSVSEVAKTLENLHGEDGWRSISEAHSIHIQGLKSEALKKSVTRMGIICAYSGFDAFLFALKKQNKLLNGISWDKHKGDTIRDTCLRNLASPNTGNTINRIKAEIICMEYYRKARNHFVHPEQSIDDKAFEYYKNNREELDEVRSKYKMQTSPNSINDLSYHDVKLIARVALTVSKTLDNLLDPGDQRLSELVPKKVYKGSKSESRNTNGIIGFLRTEYSIGVDRSKDIAKIILAHKLGG